VLAYITSALHGFINGFDGRRSVYGVCCPGEWL